MADRVVRSILVLLVGVQVFTEIVWASRATGPDERSAAVWAAFEWMVEQGRRDVVIEEYGSDFMEFFYELATSADDPRLRARAMTEGRAVTMRTIAATRDARNATGAIDLISTASLAPEFDVRSASLDRLSSEASRKFTFRALYSLEPGEDSADAGEICDAIICLHFARRARLLDGEALEWAMSEAEQFVYGDPARMDPDENIDQMNLVTHVVYVLSDYGRLSLAGCSMGFEREYMLRGLPRLVREGEVEMASEFVDSLRILGVGDEEPVVGQAIEWLLDIQNPDGSFGDPEAQDFYVRYHSTWTALNALRRFEFDGTGPRWPTARCP